MLLRYLVRFAPSLLLIGLLTGSCSKQAEGDRCDVLNNDEDCESGLVCVPANDLLNSEADRCCPDDGERITDRRCRRQTTTSRGTGGTSSGGAGSGSGGAEGGSAGHNSAPDGDAGRGGSGDGNGSGGGTTTAGSPPASSCFYNSDCPTGQVCGPTGQCQAECREDRDCYPGFECASGQCVLTTSTGGVSSGGTAGTAGAES